MNTQHNGDRVDFSALIKSAAKSKANGSKVPSQELGPTPNTDDELEDLTATSGQEQGDEDEMSIADIYKQLTIHEDIILIVDKRDEAKIRKGLSAIKAKEIAKLKESNVPHDDVTLEFSKHPPIPGMIEGQLKLQIYLKRKASVKVHKIILPTA